MCFSPFPSPPKFWALSNFRRIPRDADIVMVDYDVNDGALLNDYRTDANTYGAREMRTSLLAATEVSA